MAEDIFTQIANFGFPMVLSIFLLVRMEGELRKLTEVISDLNTTVKEMSRDFRNER